MLDLLAGINKIAGSNVAFISKIAETFPDKFRESYPIEWIEEVVMNKNPVIIDEQNNSITFKMKRNDKDEACDVNTVISAAIEMAFSQEALYPNHDEASVKVREELRFVYTNLLYAFKHYKKVMELREEKSPQ
jgi:hypothetical protein